MPLRIPIAGARTSIYEAQGTSGEVNAGTAWAVMPEMTLTMTLNAGDDLVIAWTGGLFVSYKSYSLLRFMVNGNPISFEFFLGNDATISYFSNRNARSFIQRYVVPADGNYTIELEWKRQSGSLRSGNNERRLTVMRFH